VDFDLISQEAGVEWIRSHDI